MNQDGSESARQRLPVWWLLIIGILGVSTSTLWIRLSQSDEIDLAFRRLVLAAPVLWWLAWRKGHNFSLKIAATPVLCSGVCLAIHFGAWMASLAHLSVATSVVLVYVHPVLVYAIEVMKKQARADAVRFGGVVVTLIGTGILSAAAGEDRLGAEQGDATVGVILALVGSFSFVGYIFAGRAATLGQRGGDRLPTAVYTSRAYSVAALCLALYLVVIDSPDGSWGLRLPVDGTEWLLALMLALFPTLLGHTPLNAALAYLPPSVVSTAFLGEVAVAPLLVWAVLAEVPPVAFWWGGPLVVVGILAVSWRGGGVSEAPG